MSRQDERMTPYQRAERWPDQFNAWSKTDERDESAFRFLEWTEELRMIVVAQSWAVSLLHGVKPEFDPVAESEGKDFALPRTHGDPVILHVADAVAAYVYRVKRFPQHYSMAAGHAPVMLMVFGQLADGVEHLAARGLFPGRGQSDVCDVLRHVRNAMAHGGYFTFNSPKVIPRELAVGQFTLSFADNGQSLARVVGNGDLFDVLDAIDEVAKSAWPDGASL